MARLLSTIVKIIIVGYILLCGFLYFFQEKVIFHPARSGPDFKFKFDQKFEEVNFKTSDNVVINGLLFKADSSRGLIFYLHGNSGSANSWSTVAKTYNDLRYDVYIPDYRGYGKSEGRINSEEIFYADMQAAYDQMKLRYPGNKIIVLGYSIGTATAAKIAAENDPALLILEAPYYSLPDLMKHKYPFIPTFLLKYKFETNRWLRLCKMPVAIFHGDQDEIIYYQSSIKLSQLTKAGDTLIILNGQGHNGITNNAQYQNSIRRLLSY